MEKKVFTKIEISVIKSTAKNVAPFVTKKNKVDEQIKTVKEKMQKLLEEKLGKLELEKKAYQDIIDSMNGTVKQITGGYTTEDLIDVKKEATGQMDPKTGKEIMKTVYALKYPETVVPPTTEGMVGSDFDKDAEAKCPTHEEEAPEEMPEELVEKQAEIAKHAEADPFAGVDADPFNQ